MARRATEYTIIMPSKTSYTIRNGHTRNDLKPLSSPLKGLPAKGSSAKISSLFMIFVFSFFESLFSCLTT